MKRINVTLIIAALWVFGMGWFTHRALNAPIGFNPHLLQEIDSLKSEIKSKDSLINTLSEEKEYFENQVDEMSDELSFKESEISYWGRKYDSIKNTRYPKK